MHYSKESWQFLQGAVQIVQVYPCNRCPVEHYEQVVEFTEHLVQDGSHYSQVLLEASKYFPSTQVSHYDYEVQVTQGVWHGTHKLDEFK